MTKKQLKAIRRHKRIQKQINVIRSSRTKWQKVLNSGRILTNRQLKQLGV